VRSGDKLLTGAGNPGYGSESSRRSTGKSNQKQMRGKLGRRTVLRRVASGESVRAVLVSENGGISGASTRGTA
jgi:hypothetical protein